jgi:hypothetical protein
VKTISAMSPAGNVVAGLAHAQKLVSVFCIPSTLNPTLDAAGDVPGPGGAAFNGLIELFQGANPCPD